MKPVEDLKCFRLISLVFERLLYARVEPIINSLLIRKQAGCRRENSTVDQIVLDQGKPDGKNKRKRKKTAGKINQTENIEDCLSIR